MSMDIGTPLPTLQKCSFDLLHHRPYSPDLTLLEFQLVPLKEPKVIKKSRQESICGLKLSLKNVLMRKNKSFLKYG